MSARVRLVVAVGALVVVGVTAISILRFGRGRSELLAIYAGDAELAVAPGLRGLTQSAGSLLNRNPEGCYNLLVRPHYMQGGSGIVIAEYKLEDPRLLTFDDESFQFLSIQMPTQFAGRHLSLPTDGVDVRFSRGGQFQFLRCEGEVGVEPRGSISTTSHDDGTITVVVDIEMTSIDAKGHRENRPVGVREKFIAHRVMATTGPAIISPAFMAFHQNEAHR